MTTGGSVEEQLRWAFKMYDQDGSGIIIQIFKFYIEIDLLHEGRIDHKEMIDIITILYDLNGGSTNTAKQCAEELFRKLDKNGDGEINEEIFVEGCSKEPTIIFAITNHSL